MLCYFQSKSHSEVAKELGCPKTTLSSRVERGRELLRQRLVRGVSLSAGAFAACWAKRSGAGGGDAEYQHGEGALAIAAGQAVTAGCLSAQALALAEEAMKGVVAINGKLLLVVLALGVSVGGAGLAGFGGMAHHAQAGKDKETQLSAIPILRADLRQKEPAPWLDRFGDPLPPGAISRIGSTLFRHGGYMRQLLYTPYSKGIIGLDSFLYHWDAATGKLRWRVALDQKAGGLLLGMSNDGKKLAVLTRLEFAVVQTGTGKTFSAIWQPQKGANIITGLAISADLGTYALGRIDGIVHIHDAAQARRSCKSMPGIRPGGKANSKCGLPQIAKKSLYAIQQARSQGL